jgi:hypothetical protein
VLPASAVEIIPNAARMLSWLFVKSVSTFNFEVYIMTAILSLGMAWVRTNLMAASRALISVWASKEWRPIVQERPVGVRQPT